MSAVFTAIWITLGAIGGITEIIASPDLPPPAEGVWVARYADQSALHPFGSELEALRYAVKNHMEMAWVPFGEDALVYEGPTPGNAEP